MMAATLLQVVVLHAAGDGDGSNASECGMDGAGVDGGSMEDDGSSNGHVDRGSMDEAAWRVMSVSMIIDDY